MANLLTWVMFQQLFGFGTTRSGRLLQSFPDPSWFFSASPEELMATGLFTAEQAAAPGRADPNEAQKILDFCDENGYAIVVPDMPEYPRRLREIFAYPAALYCMGDLSGIDDTLCIGVVGTRRNSPYGRDAASELSGELARRGAITVSGMAAGIDTCCARATLAAGGRTIAVQGCGIDQIYPSENAGLRREILSSGGAVVSEFPPGAEPLRYHFPIRNRIISGLSNGVVVVEGTRRSGSLITAGHALTQGRDVFAVPGRIDEPGASGTNWLIQQGAVLVTSCMDILEQYRAILPESAFAEAAPVPRARRGAPPAQTELPGYLDENQKTLYDLLGEDPVSSDVLTEKSGLTVPQVLSALTQMEIFGLIRVHPGRRFSR